MASELEDITLHLVLTYHWYDATAAGHKRIEYREITDNWRRRIWEKRDRIKYVTFSRGYTSTTQTFKVDQIHIGACPIKGWDANYYQIYFREADDGE